MDADTYPTTEVVAFFERELVPLRVPHDHQPLAEELQVVRTPCILLLDAAGREHHRETGFLGPEDLLAAVGLGMAKMRLNAGDLESAAALLNRLLEDHPSTGAVPEALFLQGQCLYRLRNDPGELKAAYLRLSERFPQSEWTRRAFKYRLL